jgi:Mrp family chromosome partitioning ATPase
LNLALVLAHDGLSVVLADFEGAAIRGHFRIDGRRSDNSLLKPAKPVESEGITLDRFVLRSGSPLVLALPRVEQSGLGIENAESILTVLSADADIVIVHGPPPSRSRGAIAWARATEATLIVVTADHTTRADLEEAVGALEPMRSKIAGVVLNAGGEGFSAVFDLEQVKRPGRTRPGSRKATVPGSRQP